MKKKVLLGMSGGVDSSVAALLLKEQGYEVIGVTMKLQPEGLLKRINGSCGASDEAEDARRVAECLGIEYHVVDFTEIFTRRVIDYFVKEYQHGRTPNPCIACNHYLKFGAMLEKAMEMGCDFIATGHYATIEKDEKGKWSLRMAPSSKDQSYVLYHLIQEQLAHILMPMGAITKEQARELAWKEGLPVAHKPDSQEICFIPDKDYAGFIERYTGEKAPCGAFLSAEGEILGQHRGITHYTVGQRKGLGVTFGKPMYVTRICPEKNAIVLGEEGSQYCRELVADEVNFLSGEMPEREFRATVKVRYQAHPAWATVFPEKDGSARVVFEEAQRAVTPGQAVVFYDGDRVIGGGVIR